MANIIKSVSLNLDEDGFIKEFNLSPTQLLKEKIWEMRGMINKTTREKIDRMVARITEQAATIERLENVLEEERKDRELQTTIE